MGKILVLIDRDDDLAVQLVKDMENLGHAAFNAEFGNAAESVSSRKPDLILAFLAFRKDVAEVWQQLVYDLLSTPMPVMAIVSEDRVRDIALLNDMSDFILYPYNIVELEMRVKLILKRYGSIDENSVIRIGNLVIDSSKYQVTVDGYGIVLTLKEYELLRYLVTHRGRVITREVLLDQVWGYDYYGGTRTVDVHIGRLRTKIETVDYSFIKTVRGVGYIFTDKYPSE